MTKENLNSVKVSAIAQKNLSALWERAAKIIIPIAALGGFIGDVLAPIGPFVLGLAILTGSLCLFSGIIWFGYKRRQIRKAKADGVIDDDEFRRIASGNSWSVAFAFNLVASLVLILFFGAQKVFASSNPDRGMFANVIPEIAQLQAQIFNLQEKTEHIAQATDRIEIKTDEMNKAIARIDARVAQIGHDDIPAEPAAPCPPAKNLTAYGKVYEGMGITVEMGTFRAKNALGEQDVLLRIQGAPADEAGIDGQVSRYLTKPGFSGGLDFTYNDHGQEPVRMIYRTNSEGEVVRVFLKDGKPFNLQLNAKRTKALCLSELEKDLK
jgi:hypothetical protein